MAYEIAKFLHITGVVMLMGNITVTAIWKYFADRTQQPEVLSFAQKLVTYTDWSMTVSTPCMQATDTKCEIRAPKKPS